MGAFKTLDSNGIEYLSNKRLNKKSTVELKAPFGGWGLHLLFLIPTMCIFVRIAFNPIL